MTNVLYKRILEFNESLELDNGTLPNGIRAMNPFKEGDPEIILKISAAFFKKFYNDNNPRRMILGINPGRHGAGVTGITFTDTKRLRDVCGIDYGVPETHEPSSVFFYEMIEAYGGAEKFYSDYFVNAVSPLGFVKMNDKGTEVNYNFYDDKTLENAVKPFIIETLKKQLEFNIIRDRCVCLGSGKNYKFLNALNKEHKFFDEVIPLEHPRFIMQYRNKRKSEYIEKYLNVLKRD